ncbi:hypothetical protein J6590_037514 [Homalodisca vitripennis]|nr:hypothetical protein J6590_037514 [Homalodisca vitripennis]
MNSSDPDTSVTLRLSSVGEWLASRPAVTGTRLRIVQIPVTQILALHSACPR